MNIVVLGPPGAGKGTQAIRISNQYDIPHVSTGDMFRRAVAAKSKLGLEAQGYMNRGELVPDQIVIGIVRERIEEPDCVSGFLLDGFPRTVGQAEALGAALAENSRSLDKVIDISASKEELVKRLTGRRTCRGCGNVYHMVFDPPSSEAICDSCGGELWQREDDTVETVQNRLDVYDRQTSPLKEYYQGRGLLFSVNGEQGVDAVFADIQKILS